ncbi:hypothetical protein [Microbacterium sp.]|uniref:hypothetical protein n=1 Tax=Microbacterium sp. TaxID=51671 RepID=UPI0039E32B48
MPVHDDEAGPSADTEVHGILGLDPEPDEGTGAGSDTSRVAGWGRVFRGNRTLWIVAGVAVVALVSGLLVGTFVIARSDADAAPEPGLVTVPVEYGQLTNDVTIRADVGYADAVDVTIDTSSVSGPAVVTGQVPAVGAQLTPLSVALEIAGRPVIVLPGELPAYRTLRFGVSGPDVAQLKHALAAVGIDPGDLGSAQFDQATADAVAQLYAAVGYPAPPSPEGADESYRAAQEGVRSAEDALASANQQLAKAGSGPDPVEVLEVDNRIASLQRQIAKARAEAPDTVPDLEGELAVARLQREQLFAGVDTSAERSMVDSAQGQVTAAYEALERARQEVQPYLPSSEVLFLTQLPRRVDDVKAVRGNVLEGVAMTVSGAAVRLTGAAAEADARLLTVGSPARFELPDGAEVGAKITEVTAQEEGERWLIALEPDPLTPEQVSQVQGSNVRVRIGVGSTEGEVLSVPLAALSAGPGGESRVEVVEGDPREGAAAKTRLVVVEPGLAAHGAVEVAPVEGELAEGDLVVVGR